MKVQNLAAKILAVVLLGLGHIALAEAAPDDHATEAVMTVNVNEADAKTIAAMLVGIGLTRAEAIVEYREKHGRFYSPEELTAVNGIGEATVEKNLAYIVVERLAEE